MPPVIATIICAVGIAGLFWLDRDRKAKTSHALWIPTIWLLLACSRSATAWLGMESPDSASAMMDGSPMERLVLGGLLIVGLIVLISRGRMPRILRANGPVFFFYLYCLFSILWSDFPAIALRRWPRSLGDVIMVLIVLTDPQPLAAFRRLLARLGFFLIPLSILFIKYYPALGMAWNPWTGSAEYIGVTENKNTLGVVCLCLGLASLWRLFSAFKDWRGLARIRQLTAHGIILIMTIYLFVRMNAMTSTSCFVMASALMAVASMRISFRRPAIVHAMVVFMVVASVSVLFLGVSPDALKAIGRNPTLTERTIIWQEMLKQVSNPVFGTGFENFWLGKRLDEIWRQTGTLHPNEAHDGYLEVYLNLGWVGIGLLGFVLAMGYRTVFREWRNGDPRGPLLLAYFCSALIYNCTEAAFFKMQAPAWLFLLFAITCLPRKSVVRGSVTGIDIVPDPWLAGVQGESLPSSRNKKGVGSGVVVGKWA
jgi:O-antigen ligase